MQSPEDLDRIKAKRGAARARATRTITIIDQLASTEPSNITNGVRQHLISSEQVLNQTLSDLTTLDGQIHDQLLPDEIPADDEKCFEYQEKIFQAIALAKDFLQRATKAELASQQQAAPSVSVSRQQSTDHLKLPRLDLPTFDGTYTKWVSFFDLFQGAVHNNADLSNSQKLFYLKSALKGEAQKLLSTVTVTDSNYDVAQRLLSDRYDNKRVILREHLSVLFKAPCVEENDGHGLRKMMELAHEQRLAFQAMGFDMNEMADTFMVYIIVEKLDRESLKQWELAHPGKDLQNYDQLYRFLQSRCQALEAANVMRDHNAYNLDGRNGLSGPSKVHNKSFNKGKSHSLSINQNNCYSCEEAHKVFHCPKFKGLALDARRELVNQKKACFNCLQQGHVSRQCPSTSTCRTCGGRHNTLLHKDKLDKEHSKSNNSNNAHALINHTLHKRQVLLQTALIDVLNSNGKPIKCRALLDSGSQMNLISNQCRKKLRLPLEEKTMNFTVAGNRETAAAGKCNMYLPISGTTVKTSALVLQGNLTGLVPSAPFPMIEFTNDFKLADPNFNEPSQIDIILGAELYESLRLPGIERNGEAVFTNTVFGYVASGTVADDQVSHAVVNFIQAHDNDLRRFWETEEVPRKPEFSPEERLVEQHFDETTQRKPDGRFVVDLPRSNSTIPLGESLSQAKTRLLSQEKRFRTNPKLAEQYAAFIKEFQDLGHLEQVPSDEIDINAAMHFYMPHHAVFKESSTTTKLRVVFDGSAKTTTGVSLNDTLMVGPTIQQGVFDLIFRFRFYQIGFTADIAKMYRQIELTKSARDFHRIVWRSSSNMPIEHWRMTRVTYGIATSAYHSIRALQETAKETVDENVKQTILKDFYVDDLLSGANSIEEAKQMQDELNKTLNKGQFSLRKWISNESELIQRLPQELRGCNPYEVEPNATVKTLGIIWNHLDDKFHFTIAESTSVAGTKRQVTSECSKIFDPLGWLAPIVIKFKLWIQRVWLEGKGWDDPLPDNLIQEFQADKSDLKELTKLSLPRRVTMDNYVKMEFHCFADASIKAYAAVIYVVTEQENGSRQSAIVTSKSKVAPVKTISLPRLELCAAQLAVKLYQQVLVSIQSLSLPSHEVFAWSDSTITLAWLNALPLKWTTFIANRVSEIQDVISPSNWRHVPSQLNPADIASRGTHANKLLTDDLWWRGPDFLVQDKSTWPIQSTNAMENPPEQRKSLAATISTPLPTMAVDIDRFSCYQRLLGTTARVFKFIQYLKTKINTPLKPHDLLQAETFLIQKTQETHFSHEYELLQQGKSVPKNSPLYPLDPLFDEESRLIKVGGRTYQSNLDENFKHQVILPKTHLTKLIVQHYHKRALHAGAQTTLYQTRERFWIINGRKYVRQILHQCTTCHRFAQDKTHPKMGPLPEERITPGRPFQNTGIDFAGPFKTKAKTSSKIIDKTYMCLFVCFTTKAIHLEAVSSLTKEACIASLKRFVARRGAPEVIFSDNATNFIGARNDLLKLKDILAEREDESLAHYATMHGMNWVMIPPRAPNFGGLWEAGIKSAKHHIRRVMGNTTLTFEEFNTLLTQIEAILNSRPISPMSSDPNDDAPLSPGHFLIGSQLTALPEKITSKKGISLARRFELVKTLTEHFWNRWSKEYLSNLQPLTKWQDATDAPKAGDVVLILEDNVPPLHWPRARIEDLYLGNDKIARVAKVFNGKSSFIRPLSKLRLLPKQLPHVAAMNEQSNTRSDSTMPVDVTRSDPTMYPITT